MYPRPSGAILLPVNPDAAQKLQIDLYRKMSGAQRLSIALGLHEMACDIARAGIKSRVPHASDIEVERQLHDRLMLAREL